MSKSKSTDGASKALDIVDIVLSKQAIDPVVLDVRDISSLCDYFVICSGDTGRQVEAIGQAIRRGEGIHVHHLESDSVGDWTMVDCFDVVVHIFTKQARGYYGLEQLWQEARKIFPTDAEQSVDVKKKITKKKSAKKISSRTTKTTSKTKKTSSKSTPKKTTSLKTTKQKVVLRGKKS